MEQKIETAYTQTKSIPLKKIIPKISLSILFILIMLLILLPIWAIFIGTFQEGSMLIRYGLNLKLEVETASLNNYIELFTNSGKYFQWYLNSAVLTVFQVVGTLLISAFVAYGFAAYDFKFKNFFFICVLIIMSVPFEMLMLPLYNQMNIMKLSDTYAAIILPFLAHSATIFFFRQYLIGIPKEIIESGRIDGATEYGIFFKLIMPIMKPSFAAMAILNGMNSWNNFLWPLLVLRSNTKYTLPIGLNTLITPYGNNYDLLIVGSFFSILPILVLFLCFQKYFIEGMTAGAVKG